MQNDVLSIQETGEMVSRVSCKHCHAHALTKDSFSPADVFDAASSLLLGEMKDSDEAKEYHRLPFHLGQGCRTGGRTYFCGGQVAIVPSRGGTASVTGLLPSTSKTLQFYARELCVSNML